MKNNNCLFFCIYLLCFTVISEEKIKADSTHFPIKPTSEWKVYYEEMHYGTSHSQGDEITRFFVNGDTSINGIVYFKLYKSGTAFYDVEFLFNDIYVGAIRDENNKFYFVEKDTSFDTLLYDFNLTVDDTIKSSVDEGMIVSRIDTLQGGRKKITYKKTNFQHGKCSYWGNSFFVEGIGSMGGLFYASPCFHVGYREHFLSCYSENSKIIFQSPLSTRNCFESTSYYPINPNGKWNIIVINGEDFNKIDEKYTYFIEGDTTISNLMYYKLYKTGVAYYDEPFYYNKLYMGALRDAENKFYLVEKDQSSEKMLYDFSLNIKDTINGEIGKGKIINSVETLYDGRRKIASIPGICAHCCQRPTFIEGIGHASGLIEEPSCNHPGFQNFVLTCYFEGVNLVYENPDYSSKYCNSDVSIPSNPVTAYKLNVYPVSSNDFINIEINNGWNQLTKIEIYNISGKLVYSNLSKGNSIKIDVRKYAPGIYFVKAMRKNSSLSGKFIVQ